MVLYLKQDNTRAVRPFTAAAMDSDLHPLLVSSIFHSILELLPVSDLLSCRQVCQAWNKMSVPLVRQIKTVKFRMKREPLDEFTQLMKTSQDFPFARFELEFYYMNDTSVQDFINTCGPHITSLQLNNCRSTTTQLFSLLQIELPNLKSFSINCDPIEDTGRLQLQQRPEPKQVQLRSLSLAGEFCRNDALLIDLMKFSPSLDALKIRCYDVLDDFSAFEQLCFSVFLNNDNTPTASKCIESLHIEFRLNESHLEELLRKDLRKLKRLHLNLGEQVRPEALIKLLKSYSNTLKQLELDLKLPEKSNELGLGRVLNALPTNAPQPPPEPEAEIRNYKIPKMTSLTRLTLTNFNGSLCFLNDCEALQYLTLINCGVTQTSLQNVLPHRNVRSFVSTIKLNEQVCLQLAHLFPRIKELQTELDDVALRVVFDQMSELEQLIIFGGEDITDDGITGIRNIFELMTIYDSINGLNEEEGDEEEEDPALQLSRQIPQIRTQPSITKLQNLRKIKILDASSLTDAAVRYGIALCKNLAEISFLNSHVTDASLEVIADNLTHLNKLELLSNITEFTPAGRSYVKSKIPGCDLILGQTDLTYLYRTRQTSSGAGTASHSPESASQLKVTE